MIKIMIVDDMPIFLEYLRGCIDWEAYGFSICCEARDGKDALEKIPEYYPDVVLTDITMPYINGIELSETIARDYPDISIILITGNNEFEYARQAVKIGVCDYIVKPFEKEELIVSLLKLQDNVNRALEQKSIRMQLERENKEQILRKMLLTSQSLIEPEELQAAGIGFTGNYFRVLLLKLKMQNSKDVERVINWEDILVDILNGMIGIEVNYEICKDLESNLVIVLNFRTEEEMEAYKFYEFQDLIKIIKSQLNLDVVIGISDYCRDITQISREYGHVLQMLRVERGLLTNILDYRKENRLAEEDVFSLSIIEAYSNFLERLNMDGIEEIVENEWKKISTLGQDDTKSNFLTSLVCILLVEVINSGHSMEDVFGKDFSPYEEMRQITDWDRKKDKVLSYCKIRIQHEKRRSSQRTKQVSDSAKRYIEENYQNPDMTITDISKALLLNQTYLRKMFKNEMNMTLTEYITKYRMHKAKKMILETDYKLSRIATEVGYSDVSYFSKCFKKYYGVSPKSIGA